MPITCRFMCPPDLPTNFSAEPCMKAGLDLSAKYLVLSDIKRQVYAKNFHILLLLFFRLLISLKVPFMALQFHLYRIADCCAF